MRDCLANREAKESDRRASGRVQEKGVERAVSKNDGYEFEAVGLLQSGHVVSLRSGRMWRREEDGARLCNVQDPGGGAAA